MNKTVIEIPTIKDDDNGYNSILKIAQIIFENPKQHFDFDFTKCAKIEHNSVVLLGGLSRYIDFQNTLANRAFSGIFNTTAFSVAGVMFLVDTMSSVVSAYMIKNNFLSHFSHAGYEGYPKGDYIGYREHRNLLDADNVANHLQEQWLSNDKMKLSPLLKEAIVSRIFEIFMNAYGHGVSVQDINKLGVYSCGQYDQKENKLNISVLDFGPGIIENVKQNNPLIGDSVKAMEWALVKGNTTETDSKNLNIPRGLGFDLLHEFVVLNKGEMRIYSNDVKAISAGGERFKVEKSKYILSGTLVSIQINCDDREYCFKSETQTQYF